MSTQVKYLVEVKSLTIGHAAVLCQTKEDYWDHLTNDSQDDAPSMYHNMVTVFHWEEKHLGPLHGVWLQLRRLLDEIIIVKMQYFGLWIAAWTVQVYGISLSTHVMPYDPCHYDIQQGVCVCVYIYERESTDAISSFLSVSELRHLFDTIVHNSLHMVHRAKWLRHTVLYSTLESAWYSPIHRHFHTLMAVSSHGRCCSDHQEQSWAQFLAPRTHWHVNRRSQGDQWTKEALVAD